MNESEKKTRLEKVSREIYPNLRRNAKLNVHSMELILRYFKWIRYVEPNGFINSFFNKLTKYPDYTRYEKKLARYKKELGFRNPNIIMSVIYTQLIAENSYEDVTHMLSLIKNWKIKDRIAKHLTLNYPSRDSMLSAFEIFIMTSVDQSDRPYVNTKNIMSYMESFMLMDNIRTYSESKDIDEVRYKWAGRVYIREINYPYLGEKKYTVNMDINIRSRYISELMGIKICRYLVTELPKLDHMNNEYGEIMSRLDSIISGNKSMTEPNDIVTISSSYQDNPADLIELVREMKSLVKGITKIDFNAQDSDSKELNDLIEALKTK